VNPKELQGLQTYLQRLFGNPAIRVQPRPQKQDTAEVYIGADLIALITLDDEDGDRSFNLQMAIHEIEVERAQSYLRRLLGNPSIKIMARPKKKDSAEVFVGEEFIAVLFVEERDSSFSLQMAILDSDIE
jgi:uncharacterized protein DUF3126